MDIADRVGPDGYTPRNRPCPSYAPNCHDPVPLSLRFLPRIAEIPVGATSASQVVVKRSPTFLPNPLNDPSLPTMREIAKSDAKGRQYLNAVIPVLEAAKMLPDITDRPILITMAAIDLKGTMSQENPTSPPPTCTWGYASGPTWSGWDAVGWQYACNPPPPPPPSSPSDDGYCVGEDMYYPSTNYTQACSIYCAASFIKTECDGNGNLLHWWGRVSTSRCSWPAPVIIATVPNDPSCPH